MKKLGAILFVIVLVLGLPFVATAEQQIEPLNPDGAVADGFWILDPGGAVQVVGHLNDWDNMPPLPDRDDSFIKPQDEADRLTVDFADPDGGPYTAIRVKVRAKSDGWGSDLMVMVTGGNGTSGNGTIGNFNVYNPDSMFGEYSSPEWPLDPNMTKEDLKNLRVVMMFDYFAYDNFSISAIQVELISENTEPPPPLQVDFTATPTSGEEPLVVEFEADYLGEERATYEWDFGDGNKSTDPRHSVVSHTYNYKEPGTYTVILTVTDGTRSGTVTKENLITVTPAYTPVLEARTKSFHSLYYGKHVGVRLWVKNVGDEKLYKIGVAMFSADAHDADRATWTLLKEQESTFHRRWPLKPNRGRNVWMHYKSDEFLSGKYLILEVYPVEGEFGKAATFEKAETNDKVSVKILVP